MSKKVADKIQAYKDVFGSPKGKEVLKHLAVYCGLLRTSFVANDPMSIARLEGRREVILEIINIIRMKDQDVAALIDAEFNVDELL